jgi:hypothetical protein
MLRAIYKLIRIISIIFVLFGLLYIAQLVLAILLCTSHVML